MKIVFIEPAASKANVYSKLHMPLLGPLYLGTILKNLGHEVTVYNENIYKPDYSKINADIIGISILTSTAKRGYDIATLFPKEKVIIGGVHASLLPEEALRFARQVVIGEAESIIAKVIDGSIKDKVVQGVAIQNLDELPFPDFSLIKGYKPKPIIMPISSSRGCPFDCTFCSVTKIFGRAYRFRSAENILKELKSRDAKSFFFCDDNFTANPERTRILCELMLKHKTPRWTAQVRCDATKNDSLLGLMAKSGCSVVCVGFESINVKTLSAFEKKQSVNDIISAIRSFHRKKIKIHGMFVLGSDSDDEKTVWETLKFAIKEKIDTIQMMILTPFPGTKVHEELNKEKRIFNRDWSLYDAQHAVFNPKLISAKQLQIASLKAHAKFYSFSSSLCLLLKLNFRNAFFRFMGYRIVKEWIRCNCKMQWLLQVSPKMS
ncbi:MAG: radical SAM protein [Candidatus Omnitrophota bacterium]